MNASSPAIRVMLVDEQPIVLWGLEKLLDDAGSRLQVVGKVNNSSDARRLARELRPDILLMDLNLGGGQGGRSRARHRQGWADTGCDLHQSA